MDPGNNLCIWNFAFPYPSLFFVSFCTSGLFFIWDWKKKKGKSMHSPQQPQALFFMAWNLKAKCILPQNPPFPASLYERTEKTDWSSMDQYPSWTNHCVHIKRYFSDWWEGCSSCTNHCIQVDRHFSDWSEEHLSKPWLEQGGCDWQPHLDHVD